MYLSYLKYMHAIYCRLVLVPIFTTCCSHKEFNKKILFNKLPLLFNLITNTNIKISLCQEMHKYLTTFSLTNE